MRYGSQPQMISSKHNTAYCSYRLVHSKARAHLALTVSNYSEKARTHSLKGDPISMRYESQKYIVTCNREQPKKKNKIGKSTLAESEVQSQCVTEATGPISFEDSTVK